MAASERRRLVAAAEAQEVQLRVVHPERDPEDQLVSPARHWLNTSY